MTIGAIAFLILALAIALAFEAINGFHDTANAVATVIYTKSLHPQVAVIWSGFCNFLGVMLGGIAVAFSIVHLLPVDLLVHIDTGAGLAMVLALLIGAMIWNFGTWFMGIPSSSSHALIGSIIGVGLANSYLIGKFGTGVNWHKAGEVGLSLFISPLIGFGLAFLLLLAAKFFISNPKLHTAPEGNAPPPWWVRGILILTCTGVSFAHGSNDGQKGIGLIMLILIGLVPATYAVNESHSARDMVSATEQIQGVLADKDVRNALLQTRPFSEDIQLAAAPNLNGEPTRESVTDQPREYAIPDIDTANVQELVGALHSDVEGKETLRDLDEQKRWGVRTKVLLIDQGLNKLIGRLGDRLAQDKKDILNMARGRLRESTEYAPTWVIMSVALALGVGTMIGWKRIVVTIGEKIGKTHLTYAQGASAELVAMTTIGMADFMGLPVSTTHVLSSGVAGSMAANKSGLQASTIRSILMAWVLTLPAVIVLGGGLYMLFRLFV
jgi:inorganic phosphate transporter, PiT family